MNKRDAWVQHLEKIQDFFKRHNRWPRKSIHAEVEELRLAFWRMKNAVKFRKGLLPKKRAQLFQQAGLDLNNHEIEWQKMFDLTVRFIALHHRLPSEYAKNRNEGNLGRWRNNQKEALSQGRLSDQQAKKLIERGLVESLYDQKFMSSLKRVIHFKKQYGQLPRMKGDKPQESQLGAWCTKVRMNLKNGTLSRQRKSLVVAAGINEQSNNYDPWMKNYKRLASYCKKMRRLPQRHGGPRKKCAFSTGRQGSLSKQTNGLSVKSASSWLGRCVPNMRDLTME